MKKDSLARIAETLCKSGEAWVMLFQPLQPDIIGIIAAMPFLGNVMTFLSLP